MTTPQATKIDTWTEQRELPNAVRTLKNNELHILLLALLKELQIRAKSKT